MMIMVITDNISSDLERHNYTSSDWYRVQNGNCICKHFPSTIPKM